jgi:Ca2+-binding RTX toxin-like protein
MALAGQASASTITRLPSFGMLFIQDGGSENNDIKVDSIGAVVRFTERTPGVLILIADPNGSGCNYPADSGAQIVDCPVVVPVFLGLGAGNDTGDTSAYGSTVQMFGGTGNDTLAGTRFNDVVDGNEDQDTVKGGLGVDQLGCGTGTDALSYDDGRNAGITFNLAAGIFAEDSPAPTGCEQVIGSNFNDVFTGNTSANNFNGGGGFGDTMSYAGDGRSFGMSADLLAGTGPEGDVLGGFENLTGSFFGDTLLGDNNSNVLDGNSGNDRLIGRFGIDSLIGGTGGDAASWADGRTSDVTASLMTNSGNSDGDTMTGIENLEGGFGNDTLTGDNGQNSIDGGAGNDTIIGGLAADFLSGGTGTNTVSYLDNRTGGVDVSLLNGANAPDGDNFQFFSNLSGSSAGDRLVGSSGANVINGLGGDDTVIGGLGGDSLDGGAGTNTLSYDDERSSGVDATLAGSVSTLDFDSIANFANLTGSGFNDTLRGSSGANTLDGGGGNDTLIGDLGADQLVGNAGGADVASYQDGRGSGITLNLSTRAITSPDGDGYSGIERFVGSDHADEITGTNGSDFMSGDDGADTLNGLDGPDGLNGDNGTDTVNGGPGDDPALAGGEGDDIVNGGDGNDIMAGFDGADRLDGGPGDDPVLNGGLGDDTIIGGPGNDTMDGGPGNDPSLDGGAGNDNIAGGADNDSLSGGVDNDALDGGTGDDDVMPGAGDDGAVQGGSGTDTIRYDDQRTQRVVVNLGDTAADGTAAIDGTESAVDFENATGTTLNDEISGSGAPNILSGGDGDDQLFGLDGADAINGGDGNDQIGGGDGDDSALFGANGNDAVDGGPGSDGAVNGGPGDDTLAGGPGADVLTGGLGDDRVDGGLGGDTLDGGAGGFDTVEYPRTTAVNVSLDGPSPANDGGPEDGGPGDRDTAVEFERVVTGSGADTLTGSPVDDVLIGGRGGDTIDGKGGDHDSTSYADHSQAVAVSLSAGSADDGSPEDASAGGGKDTLTGIEDVTGTAADDVLIGDSAANVLNGLGGNDTLAGGLGADKLNGGDGEDTGSYGERDALSGITASLDGAANDGASGEGDTVGADVENLLGGAGPDTLVGGPGANKLTGAGGNDTLEGLAGGDVFDAGAGDDSVKARDAERDTGTCGDGNDTAEIDNLDAIDSCERTGVARPVVDSDADGVEPPADCNDANAAIKPGAPEIVGNDVDENCDGIKAPFPLIGAVIDHAFQSFAGYTVFKTLSLRNLPPGSVVKVTCKIPKKKSKAGKRSCAFKSKTLKFAGGKPQHKLLGLLKKRRLAVGTVLRVQVTAPNMVGKFIAFTIKKKAVGKAAGCLSATTGKAVACV